MNQLKLNEYKQQVADLYTLRSGNYDEGDWHLRIAHRLIEYAQLLPGQKVLDIATGTGMVAIKAAQIVGNEGRVIGIDISTGMLEVAKRKVEALGLTNVEFQLADAETLDFPANSFDCILCSSALVWMSDLVRSLHLWHRFLRPGGLLGFHGFADTAFIEGVVAQKVFEKYGVSLLFNKPTGTEKKCYDLLQTADFKAIEIHREPDGSYISLEKAKGMWSISGLYPFPGQLSNPIPQLSTEQLAQARAELNAEFEVLQTEQGIWNDMTVFYAFGRK